MKTSSTVRSLFLVLALALASRVAEAQICAGASPFSNGNVRLGLGSGRLVSGFGSADGENAGGVQLAAGVARGAYVNAAVSGSVSTARFIREKFAVSDRDDAASLNINVGGGYTFTLPTRRSVEFCPITGFARQSGPSMWNLCTPRPNGGSLCSDAVEGSARALWLGGTIGLHTATPGASLIPFVGAAYVSSQISGGGRSQSAGYLELNLGVGLLVRRVTVRPAFAFPVGLEGGTASAAVQFAINIGPRTIRERN